MVDEDGRDLAEHFYKALFSNSRRDQGVPYYEKVCESPRFRGEEAAEEETDHPGEMGEFRSLWCMTGVICEYSGLFEYGLRAYCLSVAARIRAQTLYGRVVSVTLLFHDEVTVL